MEQIRQLQEANEKLKTDMDLFAMPEPLPERPEGAPEPGSTQGTSAPKSSFSADVLGMEMPYLGEGETRVGFQHFDKVENEKARVEAMQVEQAARVTGVTPRPPPKYEKTEWPLSIVFVSSEVTPWSKTGGLADVCGSLPRELVKRGHRVMVVSPYYQRGTKEDQHFAGAFDTCSNAEVGLFGGSHEVGFMHQVYDGVDFVFVKHDCYERPGGIYVDLEGQAWPDNQFRYTLLSHAACEAPLKINFEGKGTYGDEVVFVANDWHAGLVPLVIASKYRQYWNTYHNARTITVIHNILHQGSEPATTFPNLGIPDDWYWCLEYQYPEHMRAHELDLGLVVNILKGAVATSDRVLTVSEGYAEEICTPLGGKGLETILTERKHRLDGVVNGIDLDEWNPAEDEFCEFPYDVSNLAGKLMNKRALQRELGFEVRDDVPLLGFIGRLDWQKGPDLIRDSIAEMMNEDVQLVMLGSGIGELEGFMQWAENTYNDKFRGWVGFNVPVAHRITAGCDILLMPSRFEPCGLNQLYAMRYGTVPVVHAVGGLRETVKPYNPHTKEGTGWQFDEAKTNKFQEAMGWALDTYREDRDSFQKIQLSGMTQDLSWGLAAERYEEKLIEAKYSW